MEVLIVTSLHYIIISITVIKKSETEDLTCSDQVEPIPTAFTGIVWK